MIQIILNMPNFCIKINLIIIMMIKLDAVINKKEKQIGKLLKK